MIVDDTRFDIQSILGSYYIQYNKLYNLNMQININDRGLQEVSIYIDLFDMIKPIFTRDVSIKKKFSICATIINLAAHLRGYYISRHRLWTKIYMIYGEDCNYNHVQFCETYSNGVDRNNFAYKRTNDFVNSQLELVKILCAYINDVYFIRKTSDFAVIAADEMQRKQNLNLVNIVLTKSIYAYQLLGFTNNTYIFRPKKGLDINKQFQDQSYMVSFGSCLTTIYKKSDKLMEKIVKINPNLLSVILVLNGCKEKSVNALINITSSIGLLDRSISNVSIYNDYNSDISFLYNNLINNNGYGGIISYCIFDYRFKALDLRTQLRIYQTQPESKDLTWKINLSDPDTVRRLNDMYFVENPLDLNNL